MGKCGLTDLDSNLQVGGRIELLLPCAWETKVAVYERYK